MKSLSVFYKGMLFAVITAALYREIYFSGTIIKGAFLYFTIQSNILAALCLLVLVFVPLSERSKCIIRGVSLLAITLTGLVYNFVLYNIFNAWGTAAYTFSRTITHVIAPVGFIIDWIIFDKHNLMKWKDVFIWLLYPAVYYFLLLYASFRFHFSIYFFINYSSGYRAILIWLCIFSGALTMISFAYIGFDKLIGRIIERQQNNN